MNAGRMNGSGIQELRCGGKGESRTLADQQRFSSGGASGKFTGDDRAGAGVQGVFEMAVRLDKNQVSRLCESEARDFLDLDAAIADEEGGGELSQGLQCLGHSSVIGEWLGKFKSHD